MTTHDQEFIIQMVQAEQQNADWISQRTVRQADKALEFVGTFSFTFCYALPVNFHFDLWSLCQPFPLFVKLKFHRKQRMHII